MHALMCREKNSCTGTRPVFFDEMTDLLPPSPTVSYRSVVRQFDPVSLFSYLKFRTGTGSCIIIENSDGHIRWGGGYTIAGYARRVDETDSAALFEWSAPPTAVGLRLYLSASSSAVLINHLDESIATFDVPGYEWNFIAVSGSSSR